MLEAFASVGAAVFDITMIDINEKPRAEKEQRTADELKHGLSGRLEAASRAQLNVIIRPRSKTALQIQLDDLSEDRAREIEPLSFLTVQTSPKGRQVWLAVSDAPQEGTEAAKQFKKQVKAATGGGVDKQATGAVRIAGSQNIKPSYAPNFPIVQVASVRAGKTVTVAELNAAGLIASPDSVTPARSVQRPAMLHQVNPSLRFPDYERFLRGAPMNSEGKPDRSMADFMFCVLAGRMGRTRDQIAGKLMEVSSKAQERAAKGDEGYSIITADNALATVERDRALGRRIRPSFPPAKPSR